MERGPPADPAAGIVDRLYVPACRVFIGVLCVVVRAIEVADGGSVGGGEGDGGFVAEGAVAN